MKRPLAILATVGIVLANASAASAQTGPSASLGGVSNNQSVTGYVNLIAKGSASTGVKKLEIQQNGSTIRSKTYDGIQTNVSLSHSWDTRRLANAAYTLRARTTSNTGNTAVADVRVLVNNPASTPGGVSATFSGGSVSVSWSANPEPDIQSYTVERDSGGGWKTVGTTSSTSLSDKPDGGTHSYRVSATRYSPTNGSNTSSPSGAASVTVPKSSTGSGSSGGSGPGGGSGSGTGAGSGSDGKSSGASKGSTKGSAGSGGGSGGIYGGVGVAGGRRLGSLGLPGRLRVPGRAGSARAEISADSSGWGTFEETLPYSLPDGIEVTEEVPGGVNRIAAVTPDRVIPPDGLRWVAAGLWLLVTSLLLFFLERRMARRERENAVAGETALVVAEEKTPVDAVAENIAAHAAGETRFVDVVAQNIVSHAGDETRFVDVVAANIVAHAEDEARVAAAPARRTKKKTARGTRTQTVRKTAKKQSTVQRAGAARTTGAKPEPRAQRPARRSSKTTTARKPPRPGGKRIRATKTTSTSRPHLRTAEDDSAAA